MNAVQQEISRKLDYITRIAGEAKDLVNESGLATAQSQDLLETVNVQAEMISVLLTKLVSGKGESDPEVNSRFRSAAKKYIDLAKAEIAIEMEEADVDYLEGLKKAHRRR